LSVSLGEIQCYRRVNLQLCIQHSGNRGSKIALKTRNTPLIKGNQPTFPGFTGFIRNEPKHDILWILYTKWQNLQ